MEYTNSMETFISRSKRNKNTNNISNIKDVEQYVLVMHTLFFVFLIFMFIFCVFVFVVIAAPAMVPNKGAYIIRDLELLSSYWHVPLRTPTNFTEIMYGSLKPMRLLAAISLLKPDLLHDASRSFWKRSWGQDQDILSEQGTRQVLIDAGITDEILINSLIEASTSEQAKQQLTENTTKIIEAGAFGVPSFIVHCSNGDDVMLFGSDRMHIAAMLLDKPFYGAQIPNQKQQTQSDNKAIAKL
jgi:2-hydroxychromene-2-carboxylate isomerase